MTAMSQFKLKSTIGLDFVAILGARYGLRVLPPDVEKVAFGEVMEQARPRPRA